MSVGGQPELKKKEKKVERGEKEKLGLTGGGGRGGGFGEGGII